MIVIIFVSVVIVNRTAATITMEDVICDGNGDARKRLRNVWRWAATGNDGVL